MTIYNMNADGTPKIELNIPEDLRGYLKDATEGLQPYEKWTDSFVVEMIERIAQLTAECTEIVNIIKDACDRDWKDENPVQVATIAQNAMFWRNAEIQKLRADQDEALEEVEALEQELQAAIDVKNEIKAERDAALREVETSHLQQAEEGAERLRLNSQLNEAMREVERLKGLLREYRAQPCEGPCDLCRRADEMLTTAKVEITCSTFNDSGIG